jgi:uncharacterized repeat protein (TIGR01451 family)
MMSFFRGSLAALAIVLVLLVVARTSEAVRVPFMTVAAEGGSDLSVMKIGPSSAPANSDVSFTINVTNLGPDAAPNVTLQDVIPAGMTFVSVTETSNPQVFTCGTPVPAAWDMCTTTNFGAGASSDFTVVLHVGSADPGTTFTNIARVVVTSNTPPGPEDPPLDPNTENNSSAASFTIPGGASADLSATKIGPATALPNSNVQFNIVISNGGPTAAQSVSFNDPLPGGMTFVSMVQDSGPVFSCPTNPAPGSGGTVTCTLATMNAGATASFTLTTHIPAGSAEYTNLVTVTSSTPDPNTGNNVGVAGLTASSADISATKSGPASATAGANISWTLTLANAGPETASNATLVDQLPTGTTFVSMVQNSGPVATVCTTPAVGQNGQVACIFNSLTSGASAQFTLTAAIAPSVLTLSNTASGSSDNGDSNTANNSQTLATPINTSADLGVTKTESSDPVNAGSNLTYTITVNNVGPSNAASASLSDTLPAGTTFVSLSSPGGWSCTTPAVGTGGTVSCTNASLGLGNAVFTLTVAINPNLAGGTVVSNTATASSPTSDPSPGNQSATAMTTVAAPPGGVFVFSAASYTVSEDTGFVDITVKRNGPKTQPVTVDYATADTGASERKDYTTAIGTLTFAANEDTKTFRLLVEADSFTEGTELLFVMLSNPGGGAILGVPDSTTIHIDNSVSPLPNALENARNFVRRHYHDFLNREPDTAGLDFWTEEITDCGSDVDCIERKRVDVSASFFLSIEFQETGFFAIRSQRVAFGKRSQNATRMTYPELLRDSRQLGDGVVIPDFTRLEQNKLAYTQQIVTSAAFVAAFPQITAGDYVDALYSSAGVTPTTTERNDAIAAYGAGGTAGRVAAFRKVVDSTSVRDAEFRQAFVLMEYYGYLRRTPDQPGYDFWLNKLNQFNGNFVNAEMVKAFIVSIEYKERYIP